LRASIEGLHLFRILLAYGFQRDHFLSCSSLLREQLERLVPLLATTAIAADFLILTRGSSLLCILESLLHTSPAADSVLTADFFPLLQELLRSVEWLFSLPVEAAVSCEFIDFVSTLIRTLTCLSVSNRLVLCFVSELSLSVLVKSTLVNLHSTVLAKSSRKSTIVLSGDFSQCPDVFLELSSRVFCQFEEEYKLLNQNEAASTCLINFLLSFVRAMR
jgi:hypothetical protein